MRYLISIILVLIASFVQADYLSVTGGSLNTTGNITVATSTDGASGGLTIVTYSTGTGVNSASATITAPAGALLIVTAANEAGGGDVIPISSSPTLTWIEANHATVSTGAKAMISRTTFTAGGSITVTATYTGRCAIAVYAITGNETSPAGATAQNTVAQSQPSVPILTTRSGSIIFAAGGDWSAINGARTYRTPPTHVERQYDYQSGAYTGYAYYASVTSIATYTMGMTAPSGQAANTVLYEVRTP